MSNKTQNIIKFLVCFIILVILSTFIQYFIENKSYASYTSYDITGIDETKYPGYKQAILDLKEKHPNWTFKLYYTGLDWQTVINSEYTGHGTSPKSLIYDTYNQEWVCSACGTRKYDISGRWYCASKEAIKYMMDPRNSLTENYIFQFQDLSSSVGDREAVKKVTENSFLNNDSYIDAIMTAAKQNNVSPFHIVSRIIQEQGRDGQNNPYVQGYEYEGKKVYNLFNIGATGGLGDYESGAKKAYEEGWFSVESSIIGGTKFIKQNYIDRGQVSLYFQKFNVVEPGNYYNHQYMQNIGAPRSEGLTTYNSYVQNGIENSSFEFIIPMYNNMPKDASYEPNGSYKGKIDTNIQELNLITSPSNGHKYISGIINISEIINDTFYAPKEIPTLTLKSTDGTVNEKMYIYRENQSRFYYDVKVDELDITKEYYIQANLNGARNVAGYTDKTQNVNISNQDLGQCGNGNLKAENNLLKFTYAGKIDANLLSIDLIESNGKKYITGTINIATKINNTSYVPSELPVLTLKSTDGTFSKNMYRYKQSGNTYYFDTPISDLDMNKQYYIETYLSEKTNVATNSQKTTTVALPTKTLGECNGKTLEIENNRIRFAYIATIETNLQNISLEENMATNRHYITGYLNIAEITNGTKKVPTDKPTLTLKSTDKTYSQNMYIYHEGNGRYYFDTYVEELDLSKQYYIEARLEDKNNQAQETQKAQKVVLPSKQLGMMKKESIIVSISNSNLQFRNNTYNGIISTNVESISLDENIATKRHYICGYMKISENVNGNVRIPENKPTLTLKAVDGTYNQNMYIYHEGNGRYYFDTYVEELDLTKQYYIEARLSDTNNVAPESKKTSRLSLPNAQLGTMKQGNYTVSINNSRLQFTGKTYNGIISTNVESISLEENMATKRHYICGYMKISENVNGNIRIPENKPTLTLKAVDGTYSQNMYIYHEGNGRYYFDTYVEELDFGKQYYIEVRLSDPNNIAAESQKTSKYNLPKGNDSFWQNLATGNVLSN